MKRTIKYKTSITAFSLVEVAVALAIVGFVAIGLIGLLVVGLQNTQDSRERTQAATIAEALCATRRAAPTNDFTGTTPQPGFPLPALNVAKDNLAAPYYLTRDGVTNATSANSDFGFLYKITPIVDGTGASAHVSTVYMCIYWPAPASPSSPSTSHFELTTTFALP